MEVYKLVRTWLDEMSYTTTMCDLDGHMEMVSRRVQVLGIPGVEVIDYHGFRQRRRNEFSKKLLRSITYREPQILEQHDGEVTFRVQETLKSSEGKSYILEKDVVIVREADEKWRVVLEHITRIKVK